MRLHALDLTFLGTGTSHGVPVPGCDCEVCRSQDVRNRRSRPSVLIQTGGIQFVIDTAPEFRLQALGANIRHLDAVLYTHDHSDHLHGIDDLRPYTKSQMLPVYGSAHVLDQIRKRFPYIFREHAEGGGTPRLGLRAVDTEFEINGIMVMPVPLEHGSASIYGYRIGAMAYCTDCSGIPGQSKAMLKGLEILVLDALRFRPHSTHFSVDEALAMVEELRPERTYLTHLCHDVDHESLSLQLPGNVMPAFDGLRVSTSTAMVQDSKNRGDRDS